MSSSLNIRRCNYYNWKNNNFRRSYISGAW